MKSTQQLGVAVSLAMGAVAGYASSDYGPAIWRSPCNANYYTSGYGHKFCVIHCMDGYYLSSISMFASCSHTSSSVFYCVNGLTDSGDNGAPPGEITQMVSEGNYAWHACCWNQYSFGTEHEGFESNPAWYTTAQYDASGALQRHLCDTYGIAKDRNHIVAHGEKSSSAWCSYASANFGIDPYCNTHTDPGPYWDWSYFMSVIRQSSGSTAVGPSSVSWGSGRVDVLVRGGGNGIFHKYYVLGQGWLPSGYFEELGGETSGSPAICSWASGRLDAFCWGGNNNLYHKNYTGGGSWWPGDHWENLGGALSSAPAAVSWGSNRIDIVALGGNNAVYHKYWDGSSWQPNGYFDNLGGTSVAGNRPAISSWGANRLDVFVRGTDNNLWHTYFNGSWQAWQKLTSDGGMASGPSAVSWGNNRIDIVYRASNNHVCQVYWNGSSWSNPNDKGWVCSADPSISSQGANRLDVLYRGSSDANLWHAYYDGSKWNGPEDLGGTLY